MALPDGSCGLAERGRHAAARRREADRSKAGHAQELAPAQVEPLVGNL
jgi:hypothetical protein